MTISPTTRCQRLVARAKSVKLVLKCRRLDFLLPFFPPLCNRCGAGFVCLNVSTLEELHSCGRPDHIGGFAGYTHSQTDTYTHCSLKLWQAAMLGWQLNNTKLLSVSGQAWLNPRYIIGTHTHTHTHPHAVCPLSLSHTHTRALKKCHFYFFFSLKPGSNLLFSGN